MNKTENTIENKAKFFALYWLQRVLRIPSDNIMPYTLQHPYLSDVFMSEDKGYYLELTPLSQITDEDAIECAKLVEPALFMGSGEKGGQYIERFNGDGYISVMHKRKSIMVDIDFDGYVFPYDEDASYTRNNMMVAGIDYLRSKGYALCYLDLSIEDLISYGWIKLKI